FVFRLGCGFGEGVCVAKPLQGTAPLLLGLFEEFCDRCRGSTAVAAQPAAQRLESPAQEVDALLASLAVGVGVLIISDKDLAEQPQRLGQDSGYAFADLAAQSGGRPTPLTELLEDPRVGFEDRQGALERRKQRGAVCCKQIVRFHGVHSLPTAASCGTSA